MPRPIITVDRLSKAYRIGQKDEMPDTFVGAMASCLKAPLRNWQRLRRLNTFGEPAQGGESGAHSQKTNGTNGHAHSNGVLQPSTTGSQPSDILWALRDVSFEVGEGEVVGIIGRNGAGKSTLLKILSRITEPTHGEATIRGRVSSLLEVGTGFHPELTGRENIYMNGTILGMRKREIDRKFDEIVDFSGVEKFLDTPIKRYSSGMQVRLAFAVAAHLEPEILIIDEVLAVGDAEFQKKCLGKMQDVARGGRTVLFVSHNMAATTSLCTTAIRLEGGQLSMSGDIDTVIDRYYHDTALTRTNDHAVIQRSRVVRGISIYSCEEDQSERIPLGGPLHIVVTVAAGPHLNVPFIGVGIDDLFGTRVATLHSHFDASSIDRTTNTVDIHCVIDQLPLPPGDYALKLVIHGVEELHGVGSFSVIDGDYGEGRGFHRGVCIAQSRWWIESDATTLV